jgi:hypothetical protein
MNNVDQGGGHRDARSLESNGAQLSMMWENSLVHIIRSKG